MIREATIEDLPGLAPVAETFFREGQLMGIFNPSHFIKTWETLIEKKLGVILMLFDEVGKLLGGIGGTIIPCLNTGDLVAMELGWYILPGKRGAGLKLLRAFEEWARHRGAVRIWMVHLVRLNDEKMEKFYPRVGYELMEKFYSKELWQPQPQ